MDVAFGYGNRKGKKETRVYFGNSGEKGWNVGGNREGCEGRRSCPFDGMSASYSTADNKPGRISRRWGAR